MNEELMITQQDLIDWLDRSPSNDDLDLARFIATRLEKFYDLEQQLQQKENIIKEVRECITKHIEDKKYLNNVYSDKSMLEIILELLDKGE